MIYRPPPRYAEANLLTNKFSNELKSAVDYLKSFKCVAEKDHRGEWFLNTSDSPKNNLIITGGVGVGKTWLMHAFLNHLTETFGKKALVRGTSKEYVELPIPVEYQTVKSIIDNIRGDWKDKMDGRAVRWFSTIPVLIIDEVGISYGSESEKIELFEIINVRWENMMPTIMISNLPPSSKKDEELTMAHYLGTRILDRVCDGATMIHIESETRRNHAEKWAK